MVWVTYIADDGSESRVNVRAGSNLMMGAVTNNVKGIDGECGGCLSCATCHVYVDPEWMDRIPPPDAMELDMLDMVAAERRDTSRLGCQVQVTEELDGLRVTTPDRQW